jgi:hypothetical protein
MNYFKIVAESISGQVENINEGEKLEADAKSLINLALYSVGIVAVIVIILGGVYYATSQGNADKIKKGKNTIMYGLIGFAIAILAFAIVNFILFRI